MTGETDLKKLLASMKPELQDDEYVFCTIPGAKYGDFAEILPLASFMETEGLTLLLTRDSAEKSELKYESVFKCITLTIHSSLDAVGLTAAVSGKLAEKGISANVVAAYFHDHIFIQLDKASAAVDAINELSILAAEN